MERQWSHFQNAIFNFVTAGDGNASIEAVAGSGKTTVIVEAANRLPKSTNALFLAFNKSIAEELGRRLPPNVASRTLNGLGHSAWMRFTGRRIVLDANKTSAIMKDTLSDWDGVLYGAGVRKMVSRSEEH